MNNVNFDKEKELIFNEAICKNMKGHYTSALDKVKDELDKVPLVNANAEIVDARNGKATLGEEIREINSSLEHMASNEFNANQNFYNYGYEKSYVLNGLDISYNDSVNTYTISNGKGIVNGKSWSLSGQKSVKAETIFGVSGYSVKDPYLYTENGIYYMFYTFIENGKSDTTANIGYATSQNGVDWVHKGICLENTKCITNNYAWAPTVLKENGIYYMFLAGCQVSTSTSLTSGWSNCVYVKDTNNQRITLIDPDILLDNGVYYLITSTGQGVLNIWKCTNLSSNLWLPFRQNVLNITEEWENNNVLEAPQLFKGNNDKYYIIYGGGSSHNNQRVGLAVADSLEGKFRKIGLNGMLLLDFPLNNVGCISHPNINFDIKTKKWRLYVCVGLASEGHSNQKIMLYESYDLLNWIPVKTSTDLIPYALNYIYINTSGQLIHSADLPNKYDSNWGDRIGYLLINTLTVDSTLKITNQNRIRFYDVKAIINSSGVRPTITTNSSGLWDYFGVVFPLKSLLKYSGLGKPKVNFSMSIEQKTGGGGTITPIMNGSPICSSLSTTTNGWSNLSTGWENILISPNDDLQPITVKAEITNTGIMLGSVNLAFAYEY